MILRHRKIVNSENQTCFEKEKHWILNQNNNIEKRMRQEMNRFSPDLTGKRAERIIMFTA